MNRAVSAPAAEADADELTVSAGLCLAHGVGDEIRSPDKRRWRTPCSAPRPLPSTALAKRVEQG